MINLQGSCPGGFSPVLKSSYGLEFPNGSDMNYSGHRAVLHKEANAACCDLYCRQKKTAKAQKRDTWLRSVQSWLQIQSSAIIG